MPNWDPLQPWPGQIADAFAALYDWFEDHHFARAENAAWAFRLRRDPEVARLSRHVVESGWATPVELRGCLRRGWSRSIAGWQDEHTRPT